MQLSVFALSLLLAAAMAQDTYHCPDGWELNEGMNGEHCGCFLLAGSERVTREDIIIIIIIIITTSHVTGRTLISCASSMTVPGSPSPAIQVDNDNFELKLSYFLLKLKLK